MSHSNTRAIFVVLLFSGLSPLLPSRYTHSPERTHSRVARKCVRQLYLHISNYFEEETLSGASPLRNGAIFPRFIYAVSFFFFFFFICFSLSPFLFLSLSRSRKYADAHGATHRVIDTTNGAHRIAPRNALPRRSPTRERILNERAFPRAYVMDDS